jgi:hypothetical protein
MARRRSWARSRWRAVVAFSIRSWQFLAPAAAIVRRHFECRRLLRGKHALAWRSIAAFGASTPHSFDPRKCLRTHSNWQARATLSSGVSAYEELRVIRRGKVNEAPPRTIEACGWVLSACKGITVPFPRKVTYGRAVS